MKTSSARFGGSLLASAVLFLFCYAGLTPAQPPSPPDEIAIGSKLWPERKFGDAKFTHKKHVQDHKIPCADCHHVYKDGKNVWTEGQEVKKCDACHTFAKTGKALMQATAEEKKLSLHSALHQNCRGCHLKVNKEKENQAAPVQCMGCHPKK